MITRFLTTEEKVKTTKLDYVSFTGEEAELLRTVLREYLDAQAELVQQGGPAHLLSMQSWVYTVYNTLLNPMMGQTEY